MLKLHYMRKWRDFAGVIKATNQCNLELVKRRVSPGGLTQSGEGHRTALSWELFLLALKNHLPWVLLLHANELSTTMWVQKGPQALTTSPPPPLPPPLPPPSIYKSSVPVVEQKLEYQFSLRTDTLSVHLFVSQRFAQRWALCKNSAHFKWTSWDNAPWS